MNLELKNDYNLWHDHHLNVVTMNWTLVFFLIITVILGVMRPSLIYTTSLASLLSFTPLPQRKESVSIEFGLMMLLPSSLPHIIFHHMVPREFEIQQEFVDSKLLLRLLVSRASYKHSGACGAPCFQPLTSNKYFVVRGICWNHADLIGLLRICKLLSKYWTICSIIYKYMLFNSIRCNVD